MKSVLISIQPRWCELIASGKKTVEVRKTRPKIETPFKCYIYCTKDKHGWFDFLNKVRLDGKVIGEFVCGKVYDIEVDCDQTSGNGYDSDWMYEDESACMGYFELDAYLQGKNGYGWHISDLVIYEQPKELSEFRISDNSAIQSCEHRQIIGQPEYKTAHNGWIKGSYICNKSGEPD